MGTKKRIGVRQVQAQKTNAIQRTGRASLWRRMVNYRQLYLLAVPGLLFYLIFRIAPMWGLSLTFVDYSARLGVFGSPFVGLKNFADFFSNRFFGMMLRNTITFSGMNLLLYFPIPILLALLINEARSTHFKRIVQTVVYMPHFLSWVVVAGLTFFLLSTDVGIINKIIRQSGGQVRSYMTDKAMFKWIILGQNIWKEAGWGTIVFLAAITQIDPGMYEAAIIDGAKRHQQIYYITLPCIVPTVVTLFIIRLGSALDVSFEQVLLMKNALVRDASEVFDTYAYYVGIQRGNFSTAVVVNLFKGVVSMALVILSNRAIKALGQDGIY